MTKPDDIDQDTWEKAWSIVSDIQMKDIKDGLPTGWEVFASIDRIARAIMSAKAEEREACAKIAEAEIGRVRQRMTETSDEPRMLVNQAWGMCGDTAAIIRDAIRNRP